MVLTTRLSGSSPSGDSTMIERDVCGDTIARSARSVGSPERQITRVLRRLGTLAAISSSISTLSLSAMMTMRGRRRLALAMLSSLRMSKTDADQLKMMVWSFSSTSERPLRSSSSLPSSPVESTPISAETMKMPPSVTASITARKPQPVSPPIVPESSVRISASHAASPKPIGSLPSGAIRSSAITPAAMAMTISDSTASQPMSAIGPAAIDLSNS